MNFAISESRTKFTCVMPSVNKITTEGSKDKRKITHTFKIVRAIFKQPMPKKTATKYSPLKRDIFDIKRRRSVILPPR